VDNLSLTSKFLNLFKMKIKNTSLIVGILILIYAFSFKENSPIFPKNTEGVLTDSIYIKEIKTWHLKRMESLKSETGWLNLAGLFWLKEGENTFGSDVTNNIRFPKGAPFLGHFTLKNGEVFIETKLQSTVFNSKEEVVSSLKIYPYEKPIVLKSGSLRWFVIKRGDKYGVRLRDLESPNVLHFTGIDTYNIDENWRLKAKLEVTKDKKIAITDVLGHTSMQTSPGTLVFSKDGKEYRLDAVEEGDQLFIIFKDATSGKETYGAGRFLYADKPAPNSDGSVYLDFNKAINPPCAFTEFATCPLAPKQNWLSLAITAGEKKAHEH
jgi:uncharacterized protein